MTKTRSECRVLALNKKAEALQLDETKGCEEMRIWYQSSAALGIDPKWTPYEKSLKRHVQEVARPDTKVKVQDTG